MKLKMRQTCGAYLITGAQCREHTDFVCDPNPADPYRRFPLCTEHKDDYKDVRPMLEDERPDDDAIELVVPEQLITELQAEHELSKTMSREDFRRHQLGPLADAMDQVFEAMEDDES